MNSDFTVDLSNGNVELLSKSGLDWRVTLIETGDNSMTGGRVKRLQPFIGNQTVMLT